ncbi:vesicular-fusion protein SEC18 [Wallemia mellicola]|uniref:Vesicular-fusion protein SEC18 n=1 Tax=Wallemia mellicola TaxID=1708541 RepID=A0A4T0TT66_9BASI|nr:vesicular-fusion protein SEC18 [Wallemia mellicola]
MSWFSSSSNRKAVPEMSGKSYSSRVPPPRAPMEGSYSVQAVPSDTLALSNKIFVHPSTFNQDAPAVLVNSKYVFVTAPDPTPEGDPRKVRPGAFGANAVQRQWAQLSLASPVTLTSIVIEDFLESVDIEIGTNKKGYEPANPFNADELQTSFINAYAGLVLSPGQILVMDYHGINLKAVVRNTNVVALMQDTSDPTLSQTGHIMDTTTINFSKEPASLIKLKGSAKRPAANAVISPNFKFEDMGIGGLDDEFGAIFRRAFASRVFPPGLIEKLGIQHVKGILLYGPPGTGKTLMARQIGKMLNAREPKIVNGPEILNKFVGQSEENIRKLFADAEREYREKGDESELHIIIFDELDAICKQRGSTGGGTGVGDSVVNQLLSKMDGVDQLNNILIIGMTNRLDMIDEALVRPGRLEVHMEINLPDEKGRLQILNIQTSKMRENKVMDKDVSLGELSALTKNFSGAEIGGLVKSATSFAFNRHVKVGTMAGISDDIDKLQVNRADFLQALDEVHPAFGVSEEELATVVQNGIIHYSSNIGNILNDGKLYVEQVRNSTRTPLVSVLLHGPPGSGKTALAATIAMRSNFPFIKLVSPEDMVGFNEAQKIAHMNQVFNDSYKSPLSIVVIDQIERLFDYVPIGPRFSNNVLQAILVLLGKRPPKGRRLLILATTSNRPILTDMDALSAFDAQIHVPSISKLRHLDLVLRQVDLFQEEGSQERAIELLKQAQLNESGKLLIGIKRLLAIVEMAKQDPNPAEKFATTLINSL